MSGRDFKKFLGTHQYQIGQQDSRLVRSFLSGHKPSYKPVNYEKFEAYSKIRQSSASRSLKKIEELQELNKRSKDEQMLQEHRRIWESEMRQLKTTEDKIENDIAALQPKNQNFELPTTATEELYEDIFDLQDAIRLDLKSFIKNTIQPVHDLRDDLQEWIKDNTAKLAVGVHEKENEAAILEAIGSVKNQQLLVLSQLEEEQAKIEEELRQQLESTEKDFQNGHDTNRSDSTVSSYRDNNSYASKSTGATLPIIAVGVPWKLWNGKCPDEKLKESCFENFDILDEKYANAIETMEEKYKDVISKHPNNGWNDIDCQHFNHIMEQYKGVVKNRRVLYMDRFKRGLPHKSRHQIKDFEEFWFRSRSLQNQLKSLFHAWKRDREDLTLSVLAIFADACKQYDAYQRNVADHVQQQFVCNHLHEKLLQYHTERLELMTLELEHQTQLEEKQERKRKAKQAKEAERRMEDKRKIAIHKERQEVNTAQLRDINRMRMMELQERRAQQRFYDLERVHYRRDTLEQKSKVKELDKLQAEEQRLEKEVRLHKRTKEINANVDYDPSRIFEPTEAYLARTAVVDDEEKEIQEPLFHVYTYTVDQVAQDKRLKIENALRRANLHMTDYGRSILLSAPPPSKPRKDMESSVLKHPSV